MIQYFLENIWLLWLTLAFVLMIVELSSGDFVFTCFAIGALGSMVISLFSDSVWLQVMVFAICSALSLLFIRPPLTRWLQGKQQERISNADALIGRTGQLIEGIAPNGHGYVKIDGDQWKAITADNSPIAKGERVRIIARESLIVTVEKV